MFRNHAFICFIGIDGSGKTTQALSLNDYFKETGLDSAYIWSRREPYLLKIPIKLIKRYVLKEREKIEGSAYLAIKNNRKSLLDNKLISFLWFNFSLLEYLIRLYFKIFLPNRSKDVLICDRYYYDAIVDFALSCSCPLSKIDALFNNLISASFPRPDRLYFIDVSAEVGAGRKKDGTSINYLEDRVPVYRYVAELAGAKVIDGTLPLDEIKKIIHEDAIKILKENKSIKFTYRINKLDFDRNKS